MRRSKIQSSAMTAAQTGQSGDQKKVPEGGVRLAPGTIRIYSEGKKKKNKSGRNVQMSVWCSEHVFAAGMASIPLNSSAARDAEAAFGCQQKKQAKKTKNKNTIGPILQKKDIPAQPEAPRRKDQSWLMPQTQQAQRTKTDLIPQPHHHASQRRRHASAPDADGRH